MKTTTFLRVSRDVLLLAILLASTASAITGCQATERAITSAVPRDSAARERDHIYTLLAYAVVHADWQTEAMHAEKRSRGHNIGAVLVDDEMHEVVGWARNRTYRDNDGTAHAETQLTQGFIQRHEGRYPSVPI